jgi:hypothetical protein
MTTTDNFIKVTELPADSDYHKLSDTKNYRLAMLRLPASINVACIKSFNINPATNRISSANFTDDLHGYDLEISLEESNYTMFSPAPGDQEDEQGLSFTVSEKSIPIWNIVKTGSSSLKHTDLTLEDTSGIPTLPIISQPDIVQQILAGPTAPPEEPQKKKRKTKAK